VVNAAATNSMSVLDGFTLTGGNASDATAPDDRGAGIYIGWGQPTLRNLVLSGNSATGQAGAICSERGRPQITNVTIGSGSSPVGNAGVMSRSQIYLQGLFSLTGGTVQAPSVLDVRSSWFDGSGRMDLGPYAEFYVSEAPFYDPVIVRSKITGTGTIEIAPGQRMVLEGGACVDLRAAGSGDPCGPGGCSRRLHPDRRDPGCP